MFVHVSECYTVRFFSMWLNNKSSFSDHCRRLCAIFSSAWWCITHTHTRARSHSTNRSCTALLSSYYLPPLLQPMDHIASLLDERGALNTRRFTLWRALFFGEGWRDGGAHMYLELVGLCSKLSQSREWRGTLKFSTSGVELIRTRKSQPQLVGVKRGMLQ